MSETDETGQRATIVWSPGTDLTPELALFIANIVRAGNYPETAARVAGVDRATFKSWLRRGRKAPASVYGVLVAELARADAFAEASYVQMVRKSASEGNWNAAAFLLTRRFRRWQEPRDAGAPPATQTPVFVLNVPRPAATLAAIPNAEVIPSPLETDDDP